MTQQEYTDAVKRTTRYQELKRDLDFRIRTINKAEINVIDEAGNFGTHPFTGERVYALDKTNLSRMLAHIAGIFGEQRAAVYAEYEQKLKEV